MSMEMLSRILTPDVVIKLCLYLVLVFVKKICQKLPGMFVFCLSLES